MALTDTGNAGELLEAVIAAFSILGGGMAYFSGYNAAQALGQHRDPQFVAQRINEGIGEGFKLMWPMSIVALIIVVWT
jgi:hypothetical protein